MAWYFDTHWISKVLILIILKNKQNLNSEGQKIQIHVNPFIYKSSDLSKIPSLGKFFTAVNVVVNKSVVNNQVKVG